MNSRTPRWRSARVPQELPVVLAAVVVLCACLLVLTGRVAPLPLAGPDAPGPASGFVDFPPGSVTAPADALRSAVADPGVAVVASVRADPIAVRRAPGPSAPVDHELPRFDPEYTAAGQRTQQVLLVDAVRDGNDGRWLEVLLPARPNGSTGWVRAEDVTVTMTPYAIAVHLADHRLEVTDRGQVVFEAAIAVGTVDTPTPGGRFYLNALLRPPEPDGVYGTYAYALSGFSDVLLDFAGGSGVIGIHGTNDPATIGSDVSNGCIRLRNEDIEYIVSFLPLGTPVAIHP